MTRPKVTFKKDGAIRSKPQAITVGFNSIEVDKQFDATVHELLKIADLNLRLNETWERAEELKDILIIEYGIRKMAFASGPDVLKTLHALLILGSESQRKAITVCDPHTLATLETGAYWLHRERVGATTQLTVDWNDVSQMSDEKLIAVVKKAIEIHPKGGGRRTAQDRDNHFVVSLSDWWFNAKREKHTVWVDETRSKPKPSPFLKFYINAVLLTRKLKLTPGAAKKHATEAGI